MKGSIAILAAIGILLALDNARLRRESRQMIDSVHKIRFQIDQITAALEAGNPIFVVNQGQTNEP